ncbi:hypothetical protein KC19_8G018400 [Ceratodon purpureus]|uniref:carbonic anhydrase n=1 Tax=Ceratodon purpureus TaxID=3225 RepID=A0A8T0GYG1_CERPU|nr:hypothetical protein KC19_8G018400 [Ceratodon purpureus]
MALAISSRSLVALTCDAHYRTNSRPFTSLPQPTCISSSRIVDNKQRLTLRLLKLSKIPSGINHVENRIRKPYHLRCSSVESRASINAEHCHSIADSECSSVQPDYPSDHLGHRSEEGCRTGATWKDGSPRALNRRSAMLASMAVFGVGSSCSCCRAALAVEDWNYGGPSGASKWGGTCAIGAQQSPIDVTINKALHGEALGEMQFEYKLCTPTFKNPGHGTMQVNFPEGVNKLRLKGREFNLVQFHFHTPSEHAFDGLRFPMEAHLVHQDAVTKAYAVVGVMLDASADAFSNGALAAALRYSPLEHGKTLTVPNVQVSANDLLPLKETKNDRRYIHYMGSFTTPPCTESVDWFLLEKPLRVPTTEVLEFMKFVGDEQTLALNARPIQPLGAREIFEGP